jgi:hypothetical protein
VPAPTRPYPATDTTGSSRPRRRSGTTTTKGLHMQTF